MPEEEFREILEGYLKPIHEELYQLRMDKDLETYPLKEAAEKTKINYKSLLRAANSGKLNAIKIDQKTFRVTRASVLAYINPKKGGEE